MFNHKYSFFADDVQVEKIKDKSSVLRLVKNTAII